MVFRYDSNREIEILYIMVLAWDPDFSKVTPAETMAIEAAERSGYVDEPDVDWDNIGVDED